MAAAPQTLMVFVDGVGLGSDDPGANPLHRGACPVFSRWLKDKAVPVDARLGVPGLPQSATGQAALYSGLNAAEAMGRHKEGFPGPLLKALIRERNLFALLAARGYRCAFANAYYLRNVRAPWHRRMSVTTVMTLDALGGVRTGEHLARGEAVYNDLTREHLVKRGWSGPVISPEAAAADLVRVSAAHDFTLFEYFLTDLVAHKGTAEEMQRILGQLDAFLAGAAAFAEAAGRLFLLISDHGNTEDATTRSHTLNPVPLVAFGEGADAMRGAVRSLTDFAPALLDLYPPRPDGPAPRPEGLRPLPEERLIEGDGAVDA